LLPNIAGFSYIYISQSSVATHLRCGEIFSNHFMANCPQNVPVKHFENPLTFGENMDNKKVGRFGTQCIYTQVRNVYTKMIPKT